MKLQANVGTIIEKEIEQYEITDDDSFIIIASDDILEFISSQSNPHYILTFICNII